MRAQTARAKRVSDGKSHSSVVGGSTAGLRLLCSASRLEEAKVPNETSIFADTGTALHHITEWALQQDATDEELITQWRGVALKFGDMAFTVDITEEMLTAKVIPALDYIASLPQDARIFTERKVGMQRTATTGQRWREIAGAFGTSDITFDSAARSGIVDFKFGDGRIVRAEGNTQGKFYLCAAIMSGILPVRDSYEFHIFQPAATLDPRDYASSATFTLEELIAFNHELADALEETPRHTPGAHCAGCNGKLACAVYTQFVRGITPSDIAGVSTNELAMMLDMLPSVRKWADDVERAALRNAEEGRAIPGWKLAPALGKTAWVDEWAAWRALGRLAIDAAHRTVKSCVSPAQARKLLEKSGTPEKDVDRFMETHTQRPDRGQKLERLAPGEEPLDALGALASMTDALKARGL